MAWRGLWILATSVEDMGQSEQKPAAGLSKLIGPGEMGLEGGEVGVGQLAAQQRGDPCERQREAGLEPHGLSVSGFRLHEVTLFLVKAAEVRENHGGIGREPVGDLVVLSGLVEPAIFLECPAE